MNDFRKNLVQKKSKVNLHIIEQDIEEEDNEQQSESVLERKLSSGKVNIKSDQGSYHEEEDIVEHVYEPTSLSSIPQDAFTSKLVTSEPEQSLSDDDKETVIISQVKTYKKINLLQAKKQLTMNN